MMRLEIILITGLLFAFTACQERGSGGTTDLSNVNDSTSLNNDSIIIVEDIPEEIIIEKDILYDKYTLEDEYPYKDTTRVFQWDKIREKLELLSSVQRKPIPWAVLQNRRNVNGEAPLVKDFKRNEFKRVSDQYGTERHQAAPLYSLTDLETPERYGMDGTLVRVLDTVDDSSEHIKVSAVYFDGEWMVPVKYAKTIEPRIFDKVIFVDRENQNITGLEKVGSKWLVRFMNKSTTGVHSPPYKHETPLGIFVMQEKKPKMYYLVDGTSNIAGFAPHASRFCQGGYIHGIPVNKPRTAEIETSPSLGTTPRSHMCVRVATSNAKYVYDWAPIDEALVVVIE